MNRLRQTSRDITDLVYLLSNTKRKTHKKVEICFLSNAEKNAHKHTSKAQQIYAHSQFFFKKKREREFNDRLYNMKTATIKQTLFSRQRFTRIYLRRQIENINKFRRSACGDHFFYHRKKMKAFCLIQN